VNFAKVEVSRDVAGGLGFKSKKWKWVGGCTKEQSWFKKV